jgi:hypothetical protein
MNPAELKAQRVRRPCACSASSNGCARRRGRSVLHFSWSRTLAATYWQCCVAVGRAIGRARHRGTDSTPACRVAASSRPAPLSRGQRRAFRMPDAQVVRATWRRLVGCCPLAGLSTSGCRTVACQECRRRQGAAAPRRPTVALALSEPSSLPAALAFTHPATLDKVAMAPPLESSSVNIPGELGPPPARVWHGDRPCAAGTLKRTDLSATRRQPCTSSFAVSLRLLSTDPSRPAPLSLSHMGSAARSGCRTGGRCMRRGGGFSPLTKTDGVEGNEP